VSGEWKDVVKTIQTRPLATTLLGTVLNMISLAKLDVTMFGQEVFVNGFVTPTQSWLASASVKILAVSKIQRTVVLLLSVQTLETLVTGLKNCSVYVLMIELLRLKDFLTLTSGLPSLPLLLLSGKDQSLGAVVRNEENTTENQSVFIY